MRGHVAKREGARGPSWFYTIPLGRDELTGKTRQQRKRGFRTKKLCEAAMNGPSA